MPDNSESVRAPRPKKVLWMWTGVSAMIHAALIAALCGVSYLSFAKREAASKGKIAQDEAASKKAEADEAAKAAAAGTPAPSQAGAPPTPAASADKPAKGAPVDKPAIAGAPPEPAMPGATPAPASPQAQAEKILGIDKVAKPGETPKSPFSGSNDDLLKDLK